MRRIKVLLRFFVAFCAFASLSVFAENSSSKSEKKSAQAWLKKIQSAAQKLDYAGTLVYQRGNQVRASRITHIRDAQREVEKLEILDGTPREYLRTNNEIVTYVPESKLLIVEKRVIKDTFPSILTGDPSKLSANYTISWAKSGRIAGYDSVAIVLLPKDKLRYGYKLWSDKATGLLLRAQTFSEDGSLLEQIGFTQLAIGNIERNSLKPSVLDTQGWNVENRRINQSTSSNLTISAIPAGFKKIHEMKRLLTDTSGAGLNNSQAAPHPALREVSQQVFSDGLATFSIFVEPADQARSEGFVQHGAMNIAVKRQGQFWLTIVGEVPSATIRQVAQSVELKSNK